MSHTLIAMLFIALATKTLAQWSPTIYQTDAAVNVEITRGLANAYTTDHLSEFLPLTLTGTLVGCTPYSCTLNMPIVDFQGGNIEFDWNIDYTIYNIPREFNLEFDLPFSMSVTHDQLIAIIETAIMDLASQIIALIPSSIEGREELAQVIYNNIIDMLYPLYDTQFYDLAENSIPGDFNIAPVDYSFGVATSAMNGIASITPSISFEGYEPAVRLSHYGINDPDWHLSCSNDATILKFVTYYSTGQVFREYDGDPHLIGGFSNSADLQGPHVQGIIHVEAIVRIGYRIVIMQRVLGGEGQYNIYQTVNNR